MESDIVAAITMSPATAGASDTPLGRWVNQSTEPVTASKAVTPAR